ncbi:MAG: cytochrome C [Sphingobacteriales bacterium 17-39-43]|uniref:heme-binding domain-containing protein n=1 Tax=Daejeonella sp. TaxID=2805397 RepID=UPI000BD1B3D9|nr:heme-binding domain-containing protein [Daejeonella sp.]OYY04412.1 MAG: cytochrome C [Sphingobacteriia bacterium 35-40-5]OYZ31657.1 MAG: cytochrome C [Sphingobacteriales bacterium 16-39-50]OYZ47288.1 MAG: cytochrome C [Sphingobacteriales bacterium 24-40-4]OZA25052.1 MAG: cytochrome C [Sphingobacteriales bacterium 17-39-43]OZA61630.1 MAG: cytochrome C [Sphingobacteriales bacterium 39-40-5]
MSRIKIGLIVLLVILVAIQFVQPARNQSVQASTGGIASVINVPENVQAILQNSCYDCHSNNTRYPWYATLQPGAWWMAWHIEKGKAELNFDEFGNYSKRRQNSKLKAITSSVDAETMPIPSYLLIHRKAALSKADQTLIKQWSEKARKQNL